MRVLNYNEHALSAGTRAEAIAYVELDVNGTHHVGVATSQDTVSSMLKATLVGLNAAIAAGKASDVAAEQPVSEVA
jgi:2-isopropylmalate synthase